MRYGTILILLLVTVSSGCGGGNSASGPGRPAPFGVSADHVLVVVLENHGFSQVIGSPAMPYLNSLGTQHALAANYFADTHPSIGNYFVLTVGAVESNDDAFAGTVADNNIVRVMTAASRTWKGYIESLPSQGYTGPDTGLYTKHHNPFAYMSDTLNSAAQAANMVNFTQLASDLNAASLPAFSLIVPNNQNNAHDCPGGTATCLDTDKLTAADIWLQTNIDPVITNPKFGNSVLIILWDESLATDTANGGGQVAVVMVGPQVKTAFRSSTFFQHRSTLRLVLNLLGIDNIPNAAASAPSMREFFQ